MMTGTEKWPGVVRSNFFSDAEKETFKRVSVRVRMPGLLNETVISDMQKELAKMSRQGVPGMEESMVDKMQDLMSNAQTFAQYMAQHLDKSYDKILAYYTGGLEQPKREVRRMIASGKFDFPKDNLEKEIESLAKLCAFWLKDFKKVMVESTQKKYAKCLLAESLNKTADIVPLLHAFDPMRLDEKKDPWSFLDKAKAAIEGTEPFDTVVQIAGMSGTMGTRTLNRFADASVKLGAHKCPKLYAMGSVAGKLAQLRTEQLSAKQLAAKDPLLRFMPTGSALAECIEVVSYAVATLDVFTKENGR